MPDGVWDAAYLAKVDYDLWLGPAPATPFNRNHFHYNWHWHWAYGNGDTGNQGPHQFDIARWGLAQERAPGDGRLDRRLLRRAGLPGDARHRTPRSSSTRTARVFEFATRGEYTNDEGTQRIGNLFYGTKGWVWIDGDGRKWQSYLGRKEEKGPGSDAAPAPRHGRQRPERAHEPGAPPLPELRRRDPGERSRSCSPAASRRATAPRRSPHLANIAYRVGRKLKFDGKTEKFVGDAEADKLLTRTYRAPFVVPEKV